MVIEYKKKNIIKQTTIEIHRGDICYFDFSKYKGEHIQAGIRPAIVYSNDICNCHSPVITVIPLTSKNKKMLPTHLHLNKLAAKMCGLSKESTILAECITSISKENMVKKVGRISNDAIMSGIDRIVDIQLGRNEEYPKKVVDKNNNIV